MATYKIVIDFNTPNNPNPSTPETPSVPSVPSTPSTPSVPTAPTPIDNAGQGFDAMKVVKAVGASALVAGAFKWQLSLVGRNQGNSLTQEKINSAMSIAGQVGGIVAGFATGGPLGGALAIAGVGLSYAKDVEQYNYEAKWENVGLSLARERAGTSSAVNRSRNV
ncbi:MAG: hypothetical protein IKA59_03755 [Clostridia bacterium]|nr:hypothetical protein [Clostridia bacterium]